MIKRLIEYLIIERKTEYIQYKNSLKSSNTRNYTNYSTLKTISIKISTNINVVDKINEKFLNVIVIYVCNFVVVSIFIKIDILIFVKIDDD